MSKRSDRTRDAYWDDTQPSDQDEVSRSGGTSEEIDAPEDEGDGQNAVSLPIEDPDATRLWEEVANVDCAELTRRYKRLIGEDSLYGTTHHELKERLGQGGQGVVFLSERRGADGFRLPVAIKIFKPNDYCDQRQYEESMRRIAKMTSLIARIQQDNLIDVHNWSERDRIRLMEMEWIDGFDIRRLLNLSMFNALRVRTSPQRYKYWTEVVAEPGAEQSQFKPGVAIAVIRDCLAALAALHREGIVHGDVKPANIMLKKTGNAKLIDIGSAYELKDPPPHRTCTPAYAAPESMADGVVTARSDLAGLGYVLIEMMSGVRWLDGCSTKEELLEAKLQLPQHLPDLLPEEVQSSDLLMEFCRRLVAANPEDRFPDAEQADLQETGAAAFHRQLIEVDLGTEYPSEIRNWLSDLSGPEEV
jgi:eukaryotic-like serine/threonine-protein kinase